MHRAWDGKITTVGMLHEAWHLDLFKMSGVFLEISNANTTRSRHDMNINILFSLVAVEYLRISTGLQLTARGHLQLFSG